jgi:hypothetical protein
MDEMAGPIAAAEENGATSKTKPREGTTVEASKRETVTQRRTCHQIVRQHRELTTH